MPPLRRLGANANQHTSAAGFVFSKGIIVSGKPTLFETARKAEPTVSYRLMFLVISWLSDIRQCARKTAVRVQVCQTCWRVCSKCMNIKSSGRATIRLPRASTLPRNLLRAWSIGKFLEGLSAGMYRAMQLQTDFDLVRIGIISLHKAVIVIFFYPTTDRAPSRPIVVGSASRRRAALPWPASR